jgi:hypothetical protein
MIRYSLGVLECTAVQQIRRDAGGSERMAAGGGRLAASARRLIIRKTSFVSTDRWSDCFLADAPEQPAFLVRADSGGSDPGIEVLSQAVMAGRPRGACHPSYATAATIEIVIPRAM